MDDEIDKLRAEFEYEDEYIEEMRLKANRYWREHSYPNEPVVWLDNATNELALNTNDLSLFQKEIHDHVKEQIRHAHRCISFNDKRGLAIAFMLIDENLSDIKINSRLIRDDARQDGVTKKRKPEITNWIVEHLIKEPSLSAKQLFSKWENDIPMNIKFDIRFRAFEKRVTDARKIILRSNN